MASSDQREIWFTWGTAFSGSTLLNTLLQTQPSIYGLGEAVHWFGDSVQAEAYCHRCGTRMDACQNHDLYRHPQFYDEFVRRYPEARILVLTNKHPSLDFPPRMPMPSKDWRWRFLLLSKTPHAFAHSWIRHEQNCVFSQTNVRHAFKVWFSLYHGLLEQLSHLHARVGVVPKTDDVLAVTYDGLVDDPERAVQRICQAFDVPFQPGVTSRVWTRPKSCQLNGNIAVRAQFTDPSFFQQDKKYEGRYHQVFRDRSWRCDPDFVTAALRAYYEYRKPVYCELPVLGYPAGVLEFIRSITDEAGVT